MKWLIDWQIYIIVGILICRTLSVQSKKRFAYKFFGVPAILVSCLGVALVTLGYMLRSEKTIETPTLVWVMSVVIGTVLLARLIRTNIRKTNFSYGMTGSAVQISFAPLLICSCVFIVILAMMGAGAMGGSSSKDYQQQDIDDDE